jgi:hypothetical protein
MPGVTDVQGCTSVTRGQEKVRPGTGREAGLGHARSDRCTGMYKCHERAGEGENVTTGIARVERLAWAMPGVTDAGDGVPAMMGSTLTVWVTD